MPKLPKGMFRRGSKYYVRLASQSGRRRWVSLGAEYDVACTKLREIRDQEARLGGSSAAILTVEEAAKHWLQTYCKTTRGQAFYDTTEARVDLYLTRFFDGVRLRSVSKDDLRRYRLWLEKQPVKRTKKTLSPHTVCGILADARCFFNWCVDTGVMESQPVPRKLLPRIQQQAPDRLSDDEVEKVLAIREPYAWVIRLGLGTGLRWSEMYRARRDDVRDGVLIVQHHTKSGKVRRVPLPPALDHEIGGRVGRLMGYKSACTFARKVQKLSGVSDFHPHRLRHTFACRWLENGGNLTALQEILGHASITTTQRYARPSDEMIRREAARVYGVQ